MVACSSCLHIQECLNENKNTLEPRYRAVASWSRVQGTGIPTVTAVEIVVIWLLSMVLAVPEAIGFNMVPFEHNNVSMTTCMLQPQTPFMTVSFYSTGTHVLVCTWVREGGESVWSCFSLYWCVDSSCKPSLPFQTQAFHTVLCISDAAPCYCYHHQHYFNPHLFILSFSWAIDDTLCAHYVENKRSICDLFSSVNLLRRI